MDGPGPVVTGWSDRVRGPRSADPQWLTSRMAGERIGVAPDRVAQMARQGQIKTMVAMHGPGKWYWAADVNAIAADRAARGGRRVKTGSRSVELNRKRAQARTRALWKLVALHRQEYEVLYGRELEELGLRRVRSPLTWSELPDATDSPDTTFEE